MDAELLRVAVPAVIVGLLALGFLSSLLFNVSGTWERLPEDENAPPTGERLTLGQLGPFVRGRREVPGGWQEYSGVMFGRSLSLTRRDFGVPALMRNNFPEPLAHKLHGDVFAEMKLTLTDAGTCLRGTFTPQKIDFLLAPPRITHRRWMQPVARAYRRVSPVELEEEERSRGVLGVPASDGKLA
ncbi:MAG: hypothetical protein AB2A00_04145 [Myxococcota bacterium]